MHNAFIQVVNLVLPMLVLRLHYVTTKTEDQAMGWLNGQSLGDGWRRISLANQFATIVFAIVILGMTGVGAFVAKRISDSVLRNSAGSAALYMDAIIAPHLQDVVPNKPLGDAITAELDSIIKKQLSDKIAAVKIWGEGGHVLYSSDKKLTDKRFPVTAQLNSAWAGNIEVEFDDLHDDENLFERELHVPLVEIYAPVRQHGTGKVVAVAEFYEYAETLSKDINSARLQSVLAVGVLALIMAASVSGIVRQGSLTIEKQKIVLKNQVYELSQLLKQNNDLKARIIDAGRRVAETHESVLRRVGAELHDGPTQLVSLAMLRLDGLRRLVYSSEPDDKMREEQVENVEIMKSSLDEGLREIRSICTGLALPELTTMSLAEVVELAVRNHKRRTKTDVALRLPADLNCTAPQAIKTACYRFIQEGLNNSFRHACGLGQTVGAQCDGNHITLEIYDAGTGFDTNIALADNSSLGLKGLRDRIESVGGEFFIKSECGSGTRLIARIPRRAEEPFNV